MAEKKVTVTPTRTTPLQPNVPLQPKTTRTHSSKTLHSSPSGHLFTKENYIWMVAGLAIIALGMILMSGGKSNDPRVFDQKEVYSTTRITIAPLLIIIGLGIQVFAIFRKPKNLSK